MMKNTLILYFFCVLFSGIAFSQENIEIDSQVISVNPEKEYIIIGTGENEGVEIGDGLIVHRDGEKLAEAQIIEVRADIAAAEILSSEKEIKEGDNVLIVKKAAEEYASETKKSKWTTLLGSGTQPGSMAQSVETLKPDDVYVTQENSAVRIDIDTDSNTVFSYALMVLRENGYSVTLSNRASGIILATKPIVLSLVRELWADATAAIEHKLTMSLEIKDDNGTSELSVTGFKEHAQKGKQVKFPIARESSYYNNDLVGLASKIKERAER